MCLKANVSVIRIKKRLNFLVLNHDIVYIIIIISCFFQLTNYRKVLKVLKNIVLSFSDYI